jgi:hypothetical protein
MTQEALPEFAHYPNDAEVDAWLARIWLKALPTTKAYCYLDGQGHDYTQAFIALASAWFRLYA